MSEEQMREEFEAFQRNEIMTKNNNTEADADFALGFNGKEYVNFPCMQMAWEAWQAALSAKTADEARDAIEQRDIAIDMLARWCVAVSENGASWDEWDEYYKDAAYRPGPLRSLLDAAIASISGENHDNQD